MTKKAAYVRARNHAVFYGKHAALYRDKYRAITIHGGDFNGKMLHLDRWAYYKSLARSFALSATWIKKITSL